MRKDILAKAVRLADRSTKARPETVVVAKPGQFAKKPASELMSERLYTRIKPSEMKRLTAHIGNGAHASELLRDLLLKYLDKQTYDRKPKKK
jgi:hypothetical protein